MPQYAEMNAEGYFPVFPESRVAVGLDIGWSIDSSVAVTVERLRMPLSAPEGIDSDFKQRLGDPIFVVRGIVVFPLRTAFADVIEHIKKIQSVLAHDTRIVVDCTGQLSFAEQARAAGLRFTQLSITGGHFGQVSFRDGRESVSKATLIEKTGAALDASELIIPNDLLNADVLRTQLAAFQMETSPITGQPVWGGRRQHDDTVLALSYAIHVLRPAEGSRWRVQHVFE